MVTFPTKTVNSTTEFWSLKKNLLQQMQMHMSSKKPIETLLEKHLATQRGLITTKQLKTVHSYLIHLNLINKDHYLLNIFLKSCFKNLNNTQYAQSIFNHTQKPNLHLYNTMLRGFATNESFERVLLFYHFMRKDGFLPNGFTFPFVLKACARVSDSLNLGVKLHALVLKMGFGSNAFVNTGLVCLYAKCGRLGSARKVFDENLDKNVVSWTAIISGFVGVGRFKEAIGMFRGMLEMGLRPDSFTLVRVLSACTQSGDSSSGSWIHTYVVHHDLSMNVFVCTALVDMYSKFGQMDKARVVFEGMSEKDLVSWSAMVQGYASNALPKEALDLFYRMQKEDVKPDCYTMVGVLSACAQLGALDIGNWAVNLIDFKQFLNNAVLGTSLIDMYAKCGDMALAWGVFKEMKDRDIVVWNSVMSGLAMNGHVKEVFGLFGHLQKSGLKPEGNTFMGLLCGCTHTGLVNDGRKYFNSMNKFYFLAPGIEHYGCMVDLLGRAGLLKEAHELIKSMPMKANAIVWGALLSGCRVHRDTELAEYVLERLIEVDPWNSSNYVMLSNMYSVSHRWDDAEKIRSSMLERKLKKRPGHSWTEVDGIVHEFLVGDTYHPLSDKIYEKLDELSKDVKEAGYVPTKECVHFDIEDEEKDHFVGYHSEKLAVAFALITTATNSVIRVVKNLRVCGDCHTFIKLVSKITGREIIVRDNNRFHCFREGWCSCKDYW